MTIYNNRMLLTEFSSRKMGLRSITHKKEPSRMTDGMTQTESKLHFGLND